MKLRTLLIAVSLVWLLTGCAAKAPIDRVAFDDPKDAAEALIHAAERRDRVQLASILGPNSKDILSSGDPVADDAALERFTVAAAEMRDLERSDEDTYVLVLGQKEWPFPIPLVETDAGWIYDTEWGKEEILNRRIGRNELDAILAARGYVEAQRDYREILSEMGLEPRYAKRFVSEPGTRNGLFWARKPGEPPSPLGPLVAGAVAEGYRLGEGGSHSRPVRGYRFKILDRQADSAKGGARSYLDKDGDMTKGFALLAYPERWGSSGIVSFMVNQEGVVYEKDLGPDTAEVAAKIEAFDPGDGWKEVGS